MRERSGHEVLRKEPGLELVGADGPRTLRPAGEAEDPSTAVAELIVVGAGTAAVLPVRRGPARPRDQRGRHPAKIRAGVVQLSKVRIR